jgi:hypothetical protein
MSELIILKSISKEGTPLEAIFDPSRGMNLISYKKGSMQVIDQSTKQDFESTGCGLGPLIGPHFGARHVVPAIQEPTFMNHIEAMQRTGYKDPFYDGVGRYAPWKTTVTENKVLAQLVSKEMWNNVSLTNLEGGVFNMKLEASLREKGLKISLSVVSDPDSLVGIDYRFVLPNGKGSVSSAVKKTVLQEGKEIDMPSYVEHDSAHSMKLDLKHACDFVFHPYDALKGKIVLNTDAYTLETHYSCLNQENSWQLKKRKEASYVSINPISAKNPWSPNLTVSSIEIELIII